MPVEVKRTLVKSPPELWAELSDPATLARHLDGFGEIRTVCTEPETSVEWEARDVRGTVEIEPSGWGTRVTLSVVREQPADEGEPDTAEPKAAEPEATTPKPIEPPEPVEPKATKPDAAGSRTAEPQPEAPEPEPIESEPAAPRRRRFFARLFRRRQAEPEAIVEPEPEPAASEPAAESEPVIEPKPAESQPMAESEPVAEPEPMSEPEPMAEPGPMAESEPVAEPEPEPNPAPDLAAELAAVEEAMAEQDMALLTAVLDRLGAAHHRPFSRG